MTEHKFTDEEIMQRMLAYADRKCDSCEVFPTCCNSCVIAIIKAGVDLINRKKAEIERLQSLQKEQRFSMNILELQACEDHAAAKAVNDFKSALLKKIFPYDTADKKYYAINAYAVERAIIETAELFGGKHENKT